MTEELPFWCKHPKTYKELAQKPDLEKGICRTIGIKVRVAFLDMDKGEAETKYFMCLQDVYTFFATHFCYVSFYQITISANLVAGYPYQSPDIVCVLASEREPNEANMSFNRMLERTKEMMIAIQEEFCAYKLQNPEFFE